MCGLICPNFVSKIPYVKSFIYRTFITIINAQSITAICSKMNALTVAWKPSFPDFLATRFFQIRRSFTSFENVKNLKHVFFSFASHILFEQPKTSTPFLDLPFLPSAILKDYSLKPRFHSIRKQAAKRSSLTHRVFAVHRIHRRISRSVRQRHIHDVLLALYTNDVTNFWSHWTWFIWVLYGKDRFACKFTSSMKIFTVKRNKFQLRFDKVYPKNN